MSECPVITTDSHGSQGSNMENHIEVMEIAMEIAMDIDLSHLLPKIGLLYHQH